MNANDVKRMAKEYGADLVGIADVASFAEVPAERHPSSIFPECERVIVLARRLLRGSLRGIEEGTNFGSTYGSFGYNMLEDNFLSRTTYDLTCWLEENGSEAVPLFGYSADGMPKGTAVAEGKPEPNVIIDFEVAAQAAGLAEIGFGGFPLTPEFGPRQRFAAILTDAELDADQVRDKSICGDCGACLALCPLGAYSDEREKRGVKGHECEVAVIDYDQCRICQNGAFPAKGRGVRPDRLGAACARACVVQLESKGKCSNSFKEPFRKRKPWALDALGGKVGVNETVSIGTGCDGAAKV